METIKSTNFKLLTFLDLSGVTITYYRKPGNHRAVIGEFLNTPHNAALVEQYENQTAQPFPPKVLLRRYVELVSESKRIIMECL